MIMSNIRPDGSFGQAGFIVYVENKTCRQEAGHGKRAADGIGAVVKRTADAYLNKVGDITNSVDLVKALESSSIKLMIFSEQNI